MFARIEEISTLSGTSMTYVLIHIWDTKKACMDKDKPVGDNQFVMDLYKTSERVVKDSRGRYKTQDGRFISPENAKKGEIWEMEHYQVNVAQEIRTNIEEYLDERKALEGTKDSYLAFHAKPAMVRTQDNPRGILSMSDVMGLVGEGVLVR